MAGRGLAGGNDLLGILIAQLVEVERAALGDRERLLEERRGIELAQALERPQAALAVRKQANARLVQRNSQPNGREHILQGAAAAPMHVHVAGSDPRQLERRAERLQEREALRIGAAGQELDAEPKAAGEALAQPAAVLGLARQQRSAGLRQPEDQTSLERILEIPALEDVVALGARAPRVG